MKLVAFCALLAAVLATENSAAQPYPAKPIRIVVPLAAGGTGDTLARLVAEKLGEAYGQQVVADNRPGANGIIGTELVAKASPDGYTLLSASTGNTAINAGFYGTKLPFNVERDLVAVSQIATTTSVVIVFPAFSAKSIKDLISIAKARPSSVNYASAGTGSAVHLGTALFESMAGIRMTHVPYKGSTQGRVAVVSGETDLMFDGLMPSLPLIKAGKLRALGVTAVKRSGVVPDIPTIAETVPGYSADTWYGIFVPHGTPKPIVAKLHDTIAKALQTPEMKEKLLAQGAEPSGNTPDQFAAFLKSEIVKWGKVIKDSGAKPE